MSKLIFEGDTTVNFGKYLPDPYIDKISIEEDGTTGYAKMAIEINIFLKATEETDELTLINNLSALRFWWGVGLDYTPEDYVNGKSVWSAMVDGSLIAGSSPTTFWEVENEDNSFIMNDAGDGPGYDVFYDENGDRVLKFTYKGEWVHSSMTWSSLGSAYTNIYAYTWSSAEDFFTPDINWSPGVAAWDQDYDATATAMQNPDDLTYHSWLNFVSTESSDISYEPVLAGGVVVIPEDVVWMDNSEAVYGNTPLQAIQGSYHEPDKLTHDKIVSSFQELLDEYEGSVVATTDEALLDSINNISYILITYGEAVDLLPRLNEYRKAFPSKTSATTTGQLYLKYRKKIYSANDVVLLGNILHKKEVTGSKIIDLRLFNTDVYVPPSVPTDWCTEGDELPSTCAECEIISFTVASYGTPILNRTVFQVATSGDEEFDYGSSYGWFFFDYDKAFYYTAAVVAIADVQKLIESFGAGLFNVAYQLKSVELERMDPDGENGMRMVTSYTYSNNYPAVDSTAYTVIGTTSGMTDDRGDRIVDGDVRVHSFLALRNYEPGFSSSPYRLSDRYAYDASNDDGVDGWGYVGAGAFRLMAFEFQDLMSYDAQALLHEPTLDSPIEAYTYTATVTMEDSTSNVISAILTAFENNKGEFDTYYDTAKEICAWNNIDETFNQFFVDEMEALYGSNLAAAPWVKAATAYHYFMDILYNVHGGDIAIVTASAEATGQNISPITGNIPQLEAFNDQMIELNNAVSTMKAGITDAAIEHVFTCSLNADAVSIYQLPSSPGTTDLPYARTVVV